MAITTPACTLVESPVALVSFLDSLDNLPIDPPSLYVDVKGENLSKGGALALITILVRSTNHAYFLDIQNLRDSAFTTTGKRGSCLKAILESDTIPKVFFDVRKASNTMYHQYGVALRCVEDIQLLETASRYGHPRVKKLLRGLEVCVERDSGLNHQQKTVWKEGRSNRTAKSKVTKDASRHMFASRPLAREALQHYAKDVQLLPNLRHVYVSRIVRVWAARLKEATAARVIQSRDPSYEPSGPHSSLSPWQVPPPPVFRSEAEIDAYNEEVLEQWNLEQNLGHRDTESGEEEFRHNNEVLEQWNLEQNLGHRDTESGEEEFRHNNEVLEQWNLEQNLGHRDTESGEEEFRHDNEILDDIDM